MATEQTGQTGGFRVKVQQFGSFLSGMIMPNIGAFIAWGLITALFIPDGWYPNKGLAELVGPMITFLLPVLIGFTGGRLVYGMRGGVVGATATMGMIVGADIPMLLGAMIMGPVGGYAIKKFDQLVDGKIKSGFEMLVNNFSAGIIGGILTVLAYVAVGPTVLSLNKLLASGVQIIIDASLLPLASVFIEPAKVLFLNNAINHGILGPIGIDQAASAGKSILFLLETNPGPGLGILLAYMLFGKGTAKQTAPGAAIIHFLGGIHEIYFPYILMKPILLLAVIAGGASGVLTFLLFGAGLVAAPSPGSMIALMAMTPKGGYLGVLAGVLVATVVTFVVTAYILKVSKQDSGDLQEATEMTSAMKGKTNDATRLAENEPNHERVDGMNDGRHGQVEPGVGEDDLSKVKKVIFACDAGMGSSAMGASILKNKMKKSGLDVRVSNTAISQLPDDADIVITHKDLTSRAQEKLPTARHISVENFLNSPKYDELVDKLKGQQH
ncbi:PTS mannitol transporter subunit IICB [Numidum massiliense]|uniref:PTS mannitol transporter subunit IICB n=1 Tax=Numidum massiliense TaxID=1522315 RepID=UPI0006D5836C|nr:PTS mannitol transporter subunit IICB [Numidum massiliense]